MPDCVACSAQTLSAAPQGGAATHGTPYANVERAS